MAKSHIRLNQTIPPRFSVCAWTTKARTTYYYRVDSMDAHGTSDGVISSVKNIRDTIAEQFRRLSDEAAHLAYITTRIYELFFLGLSII